VRSAIDSAGRVVIPAAIRERVGFTAGAELEIAEDELGARIQRVAPGRRLVKSVAVSSRGRPCRRINGPRSTFRRWSRTAEPLVMRVFLMSVPLG